MNSCAEPISHDPHPPHGADRLAKLADLRNQARDLHDACSELTRDLDSIRRAVDRGLRSCLGSRAADLENARLALELAAAKKKLMETAHLARSSERMHQQAASLAEENNRLRKSALVVAGPTKVPPPKVEPNVNRDIASGNRANASFAKSIFGTLRRGLE